MKRFFTAILALLFFLCALTSLAEDETGFDGSDFHFDDEGEEMDFDDEEPVKDLMPEENQNAKERMNALSGYHTDAPTEGDFTYDLLEDGSGCQTLLYSGYDDDVTVPDTLGGVPVVAIGSMTFNNCTDLESVVLPDTIQLIDNMAFFKCSSLKHITLPEGVVMLGRSCFGGCVSLESVELPESLEIVDEFVFLRCEKLKELSFGKNLKEVGPNAFYSCANLEKITLPRGTEIDETAFTLCPEDITITYID